MAHNKYYNWGNSLWIGYDRISNAWQWVDGSPKGYENWGPGTFIILLKLLKNGKQFRTASCPWRVCCCGVQTCRRSLAGHEQGCSQQLHLCHFIPTWYEYRFSTTFEKYIFRSQHNWISSHYDDFEGYHGESHHCSGWNNNSRANKCALSSLSLSKIE